MKRLIIAALLFVTFKASAQSPVPAQDADKFVGQVMATYGYVLKAIKEGRTMYITYGSKYDQKGIILKLSDEMKLEPESNFQDLKGRFITVTGMIKRDSKDKVFIDGDNPSTSILVKQSLATN
jgi:hypothetical protein